MRPRRLRSPVLLATVQAHEERQHSHQTLITAIFEASNAALDTITQLVPELDRDRAEYALASLLFEEAWVAGC